MKKGVATKAMVLPKILRYCAYQERCHQEVKQKLLDMGLRGQDVEEVLVYLIQENFLNEERFARQYAGGKFRVKRWGRVKILEALKARQLSDYCIRKGMEEITDDDYSAALAEVSAKKWNQLTDEDTYIRRNKLSKYLIAKGYEADLVWAHIRHHFSDK
jgi:regulatory protein